MRPIGIVPALAVLGGLLWTLLRRGTSEAVPDLPTLDGPGRVAVEQEESRLAEVAQGEVVRREADATEAPAIAADEATALLHQLLLGRASAQGVRTLHRLLRAQSNQRTSSR